MVNLVHVGGKLEKQTNNTPFSKRFNKRNLAVGVGVIGAGLAGKALYDNRENIINKENNNLLTGSVIGGAIGSQFLGNQKEYPNEIEIVNKQKKLSNVQKLAEQATIQGEKNAAQSKINSAKKGLEKAKAKKSKFFLKNNLKRAGKLGGLVVAGGLIGSAVSRKNDVNKPKKDKQYENVRNSVFLGGGVGLASGIKNRNKNVNPEDIENFNKNINNFRQKFTRPSYYEQVRGIQDFNFDFNDKDPNAKRFYDTNQAFGSKSFSKAIDNAIDIGKSKIGTISKRSAIGVGTGIVAGKLLNRKQENSNFKINCKNILEFNNEENTSNSERRYRDGYIVGGAIGGIGTGIGVNKLGEHLKTKQGRRDYTKTERHIDFVSKPKAVVEDEMENAIGAESKGGRITRKNPVAKQIKKGILGLRKNTKGKALLAGISGGVLTGALTGSQNQTLGEVEDLSNIQNKYKNNKDELKSKRIGAGIGTGLGAGAGLYYANTVDKLQNNTLKSSGRLNKIRGLAMLGYAITGAATGSLYGSKFYNKREQNK